MVRKASATIGNGNYILIMGQSCFRPLVMQQLTADSMGIEILKTGNISQAIENKA